MCDSWMKFNKPTDFNDADSGLRCFSLPLTLRFAARFASILFCKPVDMQWIFQAWVANQNIHRPYDAKKVCPLSYTNMNKIQSLHHVKEHPQISNFLQFESHSKCVKVRAISDLRDLYGNKIQGLDLNFCSLYDWFSGRRYWYHSEDPVQISILIYVQFQRCTCTSWWVIGT